VTIVTPWRNHRELERDYWQTIRQAGAPCQVLVVDDGSDPPLPNGVRVSPGRGFAHACNVGLELVRTDAVLFLNNDVAVSEPGWLTRLCAALEPGVLVGAELRHDRHGDVDGIQLPYLDGWCLAGMTADLRALGGFDEGYQEPSYFGDNDLALRARLAGMILREVKVGLSHKRNVTAGPGSDPRVLAATRANQLRFQALVRDLLEVTA
jgi:GT2 family glycosyltransferase